MQLQPRQPDRLLCAACCRPNGRGFTEARRAAKVAKSKGILITAIGVAPAPGGNKLLSEIAGEGLYSQLKGGSDNLSAIVSAYSAH